MKDCNKRITMLMGAGAVLGYNFPDSITIPTTEKITNEVCNSKNYKDKNNKGINDLDVSIIEEIKSKLEELHLACNFEIIFHVLEQIRAYKSTWDDSNTPNRNLPSFAPFTQSNIEASIDNLDEIMRRYIQLIMDIVNDYNEYYINNQEKEKWYGRLFVDKNRWDIFNLNYDTTLEHFFETYEDGYEEMPQKNYCRFNPRKLFENRSNLSTINHLHGCITYDNKPDLFEDINLTDLHDLYKFQSYIEVRKRKTHIYQSNPTSQAGEDYYGGSIITGLHKTDKIVPYPYQFYLGNLINSIVKNNVLIINGYSFGDLYINNIIRSLCLIHGDNAKVVLIDMWNGFNKVQNYCDFDCFISNHVYPEKGCFIKQVCNVKELSYNTFNKQIHNSSLRSSNGRLLLFVEGCKEAANHSKEILDFIDC